MATEPEHHDTEHQEPEHHGGEHHDTDVKGHKLQRWQIVVGLLAVAATIGVVLYERAHASSSGAASATPYDNGGALSPGSGGQSTPDPLSAVTSALQAQGDQLGQIQTELASVQPAETNYYYDVTSPPELPPLVSPATGTTSASSGGAPSSAPAMSPAEQQATKAATAAGTGLVSKAVGGITGLFGGGGKAVTGDLVGAARGAGVLGNPGAAGSSVPPSVSGPLGIARTSGLLPGEAPGTVTGADIATARSAGLLPPVPVYSPGPVTAAGHDYLTGAGAVGAAHEAHSAARPKHAPHPHPAAHNAPAPRQAAGHDMLRP